MKKGEKQSPELKAKVKVGLTAHFAAKGCCHGLELVPNLSGKGYLFRCGQCGQYLKRVV